MALLVGVWNVGEHFLVGQESWPTQLPEIILTAVRHAPPINEDPLLAG